MRKVWFGLLATLVASGTAFADCAPLPGAGAYQLTAQGVIRLADNVFIPSSTSNRDWDCYQAWLAVPNTPVAAAAPTAEQVVAQKLSAGVAVASTGTPALNATYAIDPAAQSQVQAVSLYIQVNARFPASQTTLAWPDITGTKHTFPTTAEFQAFATALADYVTALELGQSPGTPLTIP